jgi:hypothetical protein
VAADLCCGISDSSAWINFCEIVLSDAVQWNATGLPLAVRQGCAGSLWANVRLTRLELVQLCESSFRILNYVPGTNNGQR